MSERFIGELRILQRLNRYEFAFEADILRDGPVQGGKWEFANIEENYRSFAGTPVLTAYIGSRVGDGHNASEKVDPRTGERYRSFTGATAERIIGMISEDENDLAVYKKDGFTWLRVKGRIWTYYAHEAVETIIRTGRMDVSIEAEVHDMREVDGREVYDHWSGLGLTVLGAGVDPAVPGANIRALAAMQEEFENMKLRVASLVKEENKPQNKSKEKGLKNRMRLSSQQIRNLQTKFGDNTILAAEQDEETKEVTLCLLSKKGETAIYRMANLDESVVLDRIERVNAQVHFCAEGCDDILVDACDMVENVSAENANLSARLSTTERELEEARNTITALNSAENKRRVEAMKAKATATLAAFNANHAEAIDAKELSAITAEIEGGAYTACTDKDGNWIGEKTIEEKVFALCGAAVMEADRKAAQNRKSTFIWEKLASGEFDDGSVEAFLARNGIELEKE